MTNIELQACEAIKSLSRHAARIADALETIVMRLDAAEAVADADAAALRLHNEGEEKA